MAKKRRESTEARINMPTYIFTCRSGHTFEKIETMATHRVTARCPQCGCKADRDIGAEHTSTGTGAGKGVGKWPIESAGAGILPSQVPGAIKQLGPHHEFNAKGDAVFRDPAHRRRCLMDRGMIDKQAWY